MKQLIELKTTPISLDFKINPAKCEIETPSKKRYEGELIILKEEAKPLLDSFEMAKETAQKVTAATLTINGNGETLNMEGNLTMSGQSTFADKAFDRMQENANAKIGATPIIPVRINFEPQQTHMKFETDKLTFEWRISKEPEVKLVPGNIEFAVKEYPRLEIEYVGGFIYIPPSSDPNYEEPKFNVQA